MITPTPDEFRLSRSGRMNRDGIKQAAALIDELEKVEQDMVDISREDVVLQVALRETTRDFVRIANVQKIDLLATLNAKRDALVKSLEQRGVDFPARAPDLASKIIPPGPQP